MNLQILGSIYAMLGSNMIHPLGTPILFLHLEISGKLFVHLATNSLFSRGLSWMGPLWGLVSTETALTVLSKFLNRLATRGASSLQIGTKGSFTSLIFRDGPEHIGR
ncbi:hypothetical protein C492_15046 [Natronococcus jeotgali DSM 18795]|uniref:Uncharacterized protein n=1 Tax=Natronococcus jeotgali DSM 18795 TaxID=1227498 RepID=L9X228_9EURY|nr:hypothetical protein C492_15046 [Natronococcus jeotgali DSM 18795]